MECSSTKHALKHEGTSRLRRRGETWIGQGLKNYWDNFANIHVLVVGDFFLDEYLLLDRTLSETSLETGLEAYQVVDVRTSPGAAGTVCSNLRALGARVSALGAIGQDGKAFELKRGLASGA